MSITYRLKNRKTRLYHSRIKYFIFLFFVGINLFSNNVFAGNPSALHNQQSNTDDIIVTANPLSRSASDLTLPVTVLSGDNLLKKQQTSIGNTLSHEVGIHSGDFGPHVSRPVIRGLSGEQILILQNGVNNMDASSNSADHNIAIDPLTLEKIEIIRGPASLLYGAKAIGGVVNLIDNKIPTQRIDEPITGIIDGRYNSANTERSGSLLLEGGIENLAWHFNGFKRRTDTLDIPSFARSKNLREAEPLDDDEHEEYGTLNNSHSDSQGTSLGISNHFDKGYFGISYSYYDSVYGILGHEHHHAEEEHDDDEHHEESSNPELDMQQKRLDIAGEFRKPTQYIKSINYKIGLSDYTHTEIEGTQEGTIFNNKGSDSRIEINHNPIGTLTGMVGMQLTKSDFDVFGDEAFLPPTTTHNIAGFFLERLPFKKYEFQLSGRLEQQMIDKKSDANFGASQTKDDITASTALGAVYHLNHSYDIAVSGSYNQRAATSQELFSNGEHVSTNSFEIGDSTLETQKSLGLDVGLRKINGAVTGDINLFYNHFQNYIFLNPTGENDTTTELPIYRYGSIPAQFYGIELKTSYLAYQENQQALKLNFQGDYLEARNQDTHDFLPRISPMRLGIGADYDYKKYGVQLNTTQIFAQKNTALNETDTNGYTMVNMGLDYDLTAGETSSLLYIQATNLLNQDARNHVSLLKESVPLSGRSVMLGIRTAF